MDQQIDLPLCTLLLIDAIAVGGLYQFKQAGSVSLIGCD